MTFTCDCSAPRNSTVRTDMGTGFTELVCFDCEEVVKIWDHNEGAV